jgi:hypothetical protein
VTLESVPGFSGPAPGYPTVKLAGKPTTCRLLQVVDEDGKRLLLSNDEVNGSATPISSNPPPNPKPSEQPGISLNFRRRPAIVCGVQVGNRRQIVVDCRPIVQTIAGRCLKLLNTYCWICPAVPKTGGSKIREVQIL